MTMMPHNCPDYGPLPERLGFPQDLSTANFRLPERISSLAEKVLRRGRFQTRFASKRGLKRVADWIAALYSGTPADHLEDYPLSAVRDLA